MANKSKEKLAQEAASQEQAAEERQAYAATSKWRKPLITAAVVLASLIMAISILLPSLSAVIEALTTTEPETTEAATTEAATEAAETEEATTEDSMQSYIDTVDERYSATADTLKAKVEADATDKASLINLANTYYTWGSALANYATSDEQVAHETEVFQNAITYYDQYLALEDASAAHVNRALCQFYIGDANSAITALQEFCANNDSYAPAWANLGMMYYACGESSMALDAYNKALAVDPDDEYGLKSSIETQINTISAATEDAATTESE